MFETLIRVETEIRLSDVGTECSTSICTLSTEPEVRTKRERDVKS